MFVNDTGDEHTFGLASLRPKELCFEVRRVRVQRST